MTHSDAAKLVLQPAEMHSAWLDAGNPVNALLTWERVTLCAHGTSGPHGEVDRRTRAAAINARKRAIERFPWAGTVTPWPVKVKLTLISKSYSETSGFMHASYFTYEVTRS